MRGGDLGVSNSQSRDVFTREGLAAGAPSDASGVDGELLGNKLRNKYK